MCLQMLQAAQRGAFIPSWFERLPGTKLQHVGAPAKLLQQSDGFWVLTGWAQLTIIFVALQLVSIYCTVDLQTEDKLPAERELRLVWVDTTIKTT